jgi:hypothetical protein
MGIDPESFTVGVEQTTSHPYGVTSASIYTSQHTLEGIEDQILGYNLTSLSCSQLMSRQLKVP